MNRKDNARSRHSREKIRGALLHLLETKEFEELTVSEVCREAEVNRSTFYAHYEGLWDVMDELEAEMDDELIAQFSWLRKDNWESALTDRKCFVLTLSQIKKYPAFYRARLNNSSVSKRRMKPGLDYLTQELILPYARQYFDCEPLLQYHMIYAQTGMIEVARAWLNDGCQEETEAMAELLYDLMVKPYLKELDNKTEILTESGIK